MMTIDLLANLNPQQLAAVTAPDGAILVLAGPGSGKTGVLTRRIAYLIRERGVRPWHIMAVTFTNKAAAEMRHRVQNYVPGDMGMGFQIGTFHSTCARILRTEFEYTPYKKDFVIYDTDDQISTITRVLEDLDIDKKKNSPRAILAAISHAKNEMILPEQYSGNDYFTEIVSRVYPLYQRYLVNANALDFDDLLVQMVLAMQNSQTLREKYQMRYPYVLVDEFQDTNSVQYQLVQLFGAPQNNIFAVGDEDQSIYAFRGADYRNVLRFRHDYPNAQVILLEQNYRSTQIVLDVARAVIDRNQNRTVKQLFTDKKGGEKVNIYEAYDDEYEARFVSDQIAYLRSRGYKYSDMAVMYRTNGQSRALEDRFIHQTTPYTLVGDVSFYKRREIKDLLGYLRVIHNPEDRVSLERIINIPKRGIGEKSVADFYRWLEIHQLTAEEGLFKLQNGEAVALAPRIAKSMTEFALQLFKWRDMVETGYLVQLFDTIVSDLKYRVYLREISETEPEAQTREENLEVLRISMRQADDDQKPLSEVVADAVLMQEAAETVESSNSDKVTLLTLHAAKGLEFPVVFITGLEQGILPHQRSIENPDDIEEERRLFYVGITRAKERLYISYAFRRFTYNGSTSNDKSRFLMDIPLELVDSPPASLVSESHFNRQAQMTRWESPRSSGLNRLNSDLAKQKAQESANNPVKPSGLAGKIVPFPSTSKPTQYRTGMDVHHAIFGKGKVIESKWQDGEELVTVAFSDKRYGLKSLLSSFANFTILK
jgi:DNA helicase II / ATP-dependent DNA helicase PcrA